MEKENKISVIVNTYNAEQYLDEVLDAVKDFDEIVVCDMESTDSTISIAQRHGCRIVTFAKENHCIVEVAREFAIHQAKYRWVLVVDADELITPELREYLYSLINGSNPPEGLLIPRRNKFLGEYMKSRTGDYQLRFFQEAKTTWPPIIHIRPKVEGRVDHIPSQLHNACIMHLDDKCLSDIYDKRNIYSDYEVLKRKDKRYGAFALIWRPLWRGFKTYFFEGNFRNGMRGFIISGNAAINQFMIVAKIIELRLRNEHNNN